jgi:protein farnesyltransferase subunit beta
VALDASKLWILYWIFHSLDLLGVIHEFDPQFKLNAIKTLKTCSNKSGGYGGGVKQLSHLDTTYAAVNTLAIIGTEEAFASIDTPAILNFLTGMKQQDGSFRMREKCEIDIRGSYCAIYVAVLLNLVTPLLLDNTAEFIVRCQTFEGGLGPVSGVEAHHDLVDKPKLLKYLLTELLSI